MAANGHNFVIFAQGMVKNMPPKSRYLISGWLAGDGYAYLISGGTLFADVDLSRLEGIFWGDLI